MRKYSQTSLFRTTLFLFHGSFLKKTNCWKIMPGGCLKILTNQKISFYWAFPSAELFVRKLLDFFPQKKLVLISTVNSDKEIPAYIKLFAKTGITQLAPVQMIKNNSWMSHLLFGAQNKSDKAFLDGLIDQIHPYYFKWSTTQIGKWKGNYSFSNQIRVHSKTDRIFPSPKNGFIDLWLPGGHFAVFISGKKLSTFLAKNLG